MNNKSFKAFIIENKDDSGLIKTLALEDLMDGDVTVKVFFSSFNFKDGLAITQRIPIIKRFPMIPGVDFAGEVVESYSKNYKTGDSVILNGWGAGESHYGGFSQYARVPSKWLIKLPNTFNYEEAMILGTAGYTAALCVMEIISRIKANKENKILVTGASGGVGSICVYLLAKLGYMVTALSGKDKDFLINIGASHVLDREEFQLSNKPLQKEIWSGAIDTVGSNVLSTILSQIRYNGIVASTGLAKGPELITTVYPFILRNITLAGVDCVLAPYDKRIKAWKFLSDLIDRDILKTLKTLNCLSDLKKLAERITSGKIAGRTIIDVNKT